MRYILPNMYMVLIRFGETFYRIGNPRKNHRGGTFVTPHCWIRIVAIANNITDQKVDTSCFRFLQWDNKTRGQPITVWLEASGQSVDTLFNGSFLSTVDLFVLCFVDNTDVRDRQNFFCRTFYVDTSGTVRVWSVVCDLCTSQLSGELLWKKYQASLWYWLMRLGHTAAGLAYFDRAKIGLNRRGRLSKQGQKKNGEIWLVRRVHSVNDNGERATKFIHFSGSSSMFAVVLCLVLQTVHK